MLDHIIDYNFTYIPWYILLTWVKKNLKTLQNIRIEKQNNIDNNFETFIVEKTSSNMQYIIT
jgi:DNA replication protein DnaD